MLESIYLVFALQLKWGINSLLVSIVSPALWCPAWPPASQGNLGTKKPAALPRIIQPFLVRSTKVVSIASQWFISGSINGFVLGLRMRGQGTKTISIFITRACLTRPEARATDPNLTPILLFSYWDQIIPPNLTVHAFQHQASRCGLFSRHLTLSHHSMWRGAARGQLCRVFRRTLLMLNLMGSLDKYLQMRRTRQFIKSHYDHHLGLQSCINRYIFRSLWISDHSQLYNLRVHWFNRENM